MENRGKTPSHRLSNSGGTRSPYYPPHKEAPEPSVTIPRFDVHNLGSTQQIYFNY